MGRIVLSLVSTVGLLVGGPAALSSSPQTAPIVGAVPDHHQATFIHLIDVGGRLPVLQGLRASPTATVTPRTYPVASGSHYLSAEQVASYARRAGFSEDLIDDLVRIAYRESHFCPTAVYPGHCPGSFVEGGPACSLWQLNPCPGPEAADPMAATWLAREKCLADVAAGYSCLRPWGG